MVKRLILLLLLIPNLALSAPAPSSVSGDPAHGATLVISGTDFGTKSPAAPLMWDNGEAATIEDTSVVENSVTATGRSAVKSDGTYGYDEVWPRSYGGADAVSDSPDHFMQYREVYRGHAMPHSNSTKYLVAGHYQDPDNDPAYQNDDTALDGAYQDLLVTVDSGTLENHILYATWYTRFDSNWTSASENDCGINNKVYVVNSTDQAWGGVGESEAYMNYHGQFENPSSDAEVNYMVFQGGTAVTTIDSGFPNGKTQWLKFRHMQKNSAVDGIKEFYVNNVLACHWTNTPFNEGRWRSFSIGAYWRKLVDGYGCDVSDCSGCTTCTDALCNRGDSNNYRYFDDIYIDNTFSRVMLGNSATYSACTILEPQIPSAWSTTEITATMNLGALPSTGTVYLFVFDSDNTANVTGYPIALSTGTGSVHYLGSGSIQFSGGGTINWQAE